ncbi:MAG TPA: HAMP domain-containing sensor histidine kinase [Ktedonobacterales bacterium]
MSDTKYDDDTHHIQAGERHQTEPVSAMAFLNIAGHELRAPVTALKGQLQLMQRRIRREGGRERDDESLTKMLYQIERMQQLVMVYLDAAYQARGDLSLMRQPANLVAVVERINTLYGIASAKHPVRLDTTETTLNGQFDTGRIDLVMRELLGNAFRYAQEGEIVVRLRREGDMATVEVEDAGPVIAAERVDTIFEPYVTDSRAQNTGLGLGLFIARQVVRLHGGEMGLRKGDRGNVFWFTLPLDSFTT